MFPHVKFYVKVGNTNSIMCFLNVLVFSSFANFTLVIRKTGIQIVTAIFQDFVLSSGKRPIVLPTMSYRMHTLIKQINIDNQDMIREAVKKKSGQTWDIVPSSLPPTPPY